MANFTSEEIQVAVEKLVLASIRKPQGSLGERKVDVTFSDIQEAAGGVFLLYFNAPFYVCFLGAQLLREVVESEVQLIDDVVDLIGSLDRLVTPIKDLSPLANARVALGELSTALDRRDTAFEDIETVPAWRRYAQNIDEFLTGAGANIKKSGSVVQTPQAARQLLPGLITALKENHEELVRRAKLLTNAIDEFEALNLPGLVAQGVISRSQEVLSARFAELSALPEAQRLEKVREVVLDLLAQKAVVQNFGSGKKPTPFHDLEGVGTPYSDAVHLASPANLDATLFGPYVITDSGFNVEVTLDGGSPLNLALPLSFVAELTSRLAEPYNVPSSSEIELEIEGSLFTVTFVANTSKPAQDVVNEINAVIGSTDTEAQLVFFPLRLDSLVNTTNTGGSTANFTLIAGDIDSQLGIALGDEIDILDGPNAGETWTVTGIGPNFLAASGPGPMTASLGVRIQVGPPERSIRLIDTDASSSVAARRRIRLVSDIGGVHDVTAVNLGFFPEQTARSRPTIAQDLVTAVNGSFSTLSAGLLLETAVYSGQARSVEVDAGTVVLSKYEATGSVTAGLNVTFSVVGAETAGVEVGDKIVIRSSGVSVDLGKVGTVTAVSDASVAATFVSALSASTVEVEVGPDTSQDFGWLLRILDGPNQGDYVVAEPQGPSEVHFEVQLERQLAVFKDGDQPVTFTASLQRTAITLSSRDQTISSSIEVDAASSNSGAHLLFSALPAVSRGTTPYIELAEYPKALVVGDILELYETQYNEVSRSFEVVGVEPSASIIQISPEFENNGSLTFDVDVPPPFARLRIARVADYDSFKTRLNAWLGRTEQQTSFFTNLNRFINPLLVNQNPTAVQVGDAQTEIRRLLALLTEDGATSFSGFVVPAATAEDTLEFALNEYEVEPVDAVDTLIRTFREKGADRATDLLLEGQFNAFFGVSVDGSSYAGQLMESIRDLAREDLPVRKYNRKNVLGEKLLSSHEDKDYEFDIEDADIQPVPDPTGDSSSTG